MPSDMFEPRKYQEWLQVRRRLLEQERAFARAREAMARGERIDAEVVSIQQSEIRALRALSRAMIRRSIGQGESGGPGRPEHGN